MILPIKQNDPLLFAPSNPVARDLFGMPLRALVDNMQSTLKATRGSGLSAVQIGVPWCVVVISDWADGQEYVLINPVILEQRGEQDSLEGCLSFKGLRPVKMKRPTEIFLKYQDVDGAEHRLVAEGKLAVVVAHETQHLEGKTLLDYVGEYTKMDYRRKLRKLEKTMVRHPERFVARG